MKKLQWKWALILGIFALSIVLLYPTIDWYTKTPEEKRQIEISRLRPKKILSLGLDLRGGTYLLLQLDVSKLNKDEKIGDAMSRAIEILRNRVDQYGVGETPITRQGDRWITVQLPGISNPEQAAAVAASADGVVVGSALIDAIDKGGADAAEALLRSLRARI